MEFALTRNWWMLVVRGVLAALFGIMSLFWPGITLMVLVLFFGIYALLDGIAAMASAVTGHREPARWWALLLEGVVGIGAGLITLFWPGITAIALLAVIAVWAIATGVFEIITAIRVREHVEGEWVMALAGVLSVLFGGLIVAMPGAGALAVVWLIGAYAILFGALLIMLGFQLRSFGEHTTRLTI